MIDPKEFRIGNILKSSDSSKLINVFHIDEDDDRGRINYIGVNNYQPIELTPETLEAAGCVKDIIDGWNLWINGNLFVIRKLVSAKGYTLSVGDYCLCDIEYLHTFQNAYHLLTGQELQIDVNKLNK